MTVLKLAVLPGDGIGPEVMQQALRVLEAVAVKEGFSVECEKGLVGGAAFEETGEHFPEATRALCQRSDAVLFGSVGGPLDQAHLPKWKGCEANSILALRKAFQFSANLRPARVYPQLQSICPLKAEIASGDLNLVIVRELVGDIYFGEHKRFEKNGVRYATDVAEYNETQIAAVAHTAFQAAQKRGKKLCSVDKANVLDTSRLWREVVSEIAADYPDVELTHMLVDNCAMQIITNPAQFDVIVTANLFGDILSDEAAVLPGSLGLTPSASLNAEGFGLYEPSGGSAPDIAGKDCANPIAQILSVAMMLRHSFDLTAAADRIENAVESVLDAGYRTGDIATDGEAPIGTQAMADAIIAVL